MNTFDTWAAASSAYRAYTEATAKCTAAFAPGPKAVLKAWTHPGTGEVRHYVNNVATLIGLDVGYYNTGNISSAALDGAHIANRQAGMILSDIAKTYVTYEDGKASIWLTSRFSNREIGRDTVRDAIRAAL